MMKSGNQNTAWNLSYHDGQPMAVAEIA